MATPDELDAYEESRADQARLNARALKYLSDCAIMRMEPNKHTLEAILRGEQ